MARVIWKGAISFGLVHVPVALYPASSEGGIDFDWLDKRSMDPVGYKRVNKRTGREIDKQHIVRGVKVDGGDYVVLSDEEIRAAYPKTTETIEIQSFAHADELPFTRLEKPYYLEPLPRSEKVYALLREAMSRAGVIGIARVVMHSKEYLSALVPVGRALLLNTLRWGSDIRPWNELNLPPEGSNAGLKDGELKMATQLIADMTEPWEDDRYSDKFTAAIHALVEQRVAAGNTEQVEPMEESAPAPSNVVDLTELLKRSLGERKGGTAGAGGKRGDERQPRGADEPPARRKTARKPARRSGIEPAGTRARSGSSKIPARPAARSRASAKAGARGS